MERSAPSDSPDSSWPDEAEPYAIEQQTDRHGPDRLNEDRTLAALLEQELYKAPRSAA